MSSSGMSHIYGPGDGDNIYCNVASGDFNNDGFDDTVGYRAPQPRVVRPGVHGSRQRSISGYRRSRSPPVGVVKVLGHEFTGFLGFTVEGADFNGDGRDDLVMAAGGMDYAEVYVIAGTTSFSPAYWTGNDEPGMTRFIDVDPYRGMGFSMASRDLDADGKDDLVLGCDRGLSSGSELDGRVFVLHGAAGLGDSVLITDTRLRPR